MDRDEALTLLRGGPEGIEEWHRRRKQACQERLAGWKADEEFSALVTAALLPDDLDGEEWRRHLSQAFAAGKLCCLKGEFPALFKADLHGARLPGVDLFGVDLKGANLVYANLRKAELGGADLRGADFSEADLRGAYLVYADLKGANLHGADLEGANLHGADLHGAKCWGTIFADVDLSEVKGLDSVDHEGPSTLGTDTLIRSKGTIPEVFLRGCGLPDVWITHLPSLIGAMSPIQFYSVFISYSSKDRDFADRLYADLQAQGIRCWLDREDLKIGDPIRRRIDEAIRLHDKLMLVLSKNSLASPWVEGEVESALERERRQKQIILFPVRLDNKVMATETAWAAKIRRERHIGDFRKWKDHDAYQTAFARLLRDLNPTTP